ncbi:uncharacterized protein B0T23DRAFT_381500 [Neurospora hispaniola]|uniref:Uncharacterized protein n=1 Tax=Neurospora hispaniola TaxID=588809 RepID=A0AAJ0I588_9PEZI|nr:hypothetical protein B0T23DRAFT_381500 [Neurospora hispaniola]
MGDEFTITRNLYEDPERSQGLDRTSYHLKNPQGEVFRDTFAETPKKKSKLSYSAKLIEIHHGEMELDGKSCQGTLIVFEFRFHSTSTHSSTRYKAVRIDLEFQNGNGVAKKDPVVVRIAPDKQYYLNKTTREETRTCGVSVGTNLGPAGLAGAEASMNWELCTQSTRRFKATLTGESKFSSQKSVCRNAVRWSMAENSGAKDGIPTFLQAAVLLKRNNNEPFICQLSLESDANFGNKFLRLSDKFSDVDQVIDPVTLDPKIRQLQSNRLTRIQPEDLGQMQTILERIDSYVKVSFSQPDLTPPRTELPTSSSPSEPSLAEKDTVTVTETRGHPHPLLDNTIKKLVVSEVPNMQESKSTSTSTSLPLVDVPVLACEVQEAGEVDASTSHLVLLAAQEAAEAAAAATRAATKAMEAVNEAAAAAARASRATNLLAEVTSRMVNKERRYHGSCSSSDKPTA